MGEFELDSFYGEVETTPGEPPMAPDLYDVRVYAQGGALDGVIRVFAQNPEDAYLKLRAMALSDVRELVGNTPSDARASAPVIGVDRRRTLRPVDRSTPKRP